MATRSSGKPHESNSQSGKMQCAPGLVARVVGVDVSFVASRIDSPHTTLSWPTLRDSRNTRYINTILCIISQSHITSDGAGECHVEQLWVVVVVVVLGVVEGVRQVVLAVVVLVVEVEAPLTLHN